MIDTRFSVEFLNKGLDTNMSGHLGIEFTSIGEDHLEMKMPVDHRTIQPIGILNGGASACLAETVGSMASYLSINRKEYYSVGSEIKCNHIRSAFRGYVYGRATAVHLGKRTHVWQIHIRDEQEKLVCLSTLTVQIMPFGDNEAARKMLANSPLGHLV